MSFTPKLTERIRQAQADARVAYLATVISATGSTPQKTGAKMIIYGSGETWGTIGGGDAERKLIEDVLRSRPSIAETIHYDLTERRDAEHDPDMMCGGVMDFLVETLVCPDELFVIGGGHCGVELSQLASRVGFSVTVVDDRPEWANREKHPSAQRVACIEYDRIAEQINFSREAFIVIMTHGHAHDQAVLRICLNHEARYVGMIGSPAKAARVRKELSGEGISDEVLARVHAPIGLEIGSHTPEEIAVSIVAELISVRNSSPSEKPSA